VHDGLNDCVSIGSRSERQTTASMQKVFEADTPGVIAWDGLLLPDS
jgi:hypothetical protein